MAEKNEKEKAVNEQIRDFGQVELEHGEDRISMLTIIGEIEGHECLPRPPVLQPGLSQGLL